MKVYIESLKNHRGIAVANSALRKSNCFNQKIQLADYRPSASIQRMLQQTMKNEIVIQRDHTDTGLNKDSALKRFGRKMKTRLKAGKNPSGRVKEWGALTVDEKITKLMKYANDELKKTHVPPLKGVNMVGAAQPTFNFSNWKIDMVGDLSRLDDVYLEWLVGTMYHETRHCEQWFRMARRQAGKGKTAGDITSSMGIPGDIADAAVAHPLSKPSIGFKLRRKYHERQAVKYQEAKSWYKSVYGSQRGHRDTVLGSPLIPGTPGFNAYKALPEEHDAYAVQDKVIIEYQNAKI